MGLVGLILSFEFSRVCTHFQMMEQARYHPSHWEKTFFCLVCFTVVDWSSFVEMGDLGDLIFLLLFCFHLSSSMLFVFVLLLMLLMLCVV